MPNRVEKCPLCNFEVALSSNHPHSYACPNVHRPFSQWLTTDSGHPVYPHPDEVQQPLPDEDDGLTSNLLSGLFGSDDPSSPDNAQEPDTSTTDTPDFGGGGDFAGGGGGSDW